LATKGGGERPGISIGGLKLIGARGDPAQLDALFAKAAALVRRWIAEDKDLASVNLTIDSLEVPIDLAPGAPITDETATALASEILAEVRRRVPRA
jgi:hypothetical protein